MFGQEEDGGGFGGWLGQTLGTMFNPTGSPLAQPPTGDALQGGAGSFSELPGGYTDPTGPTQYGVRGDEVVDTVDLMYMLVQGATPSMIQQEARRRKYSRSDLNKVMSLQRNAGQVAATIGVSIMDGRLAMLVDLLGRALGGGRRRKRNPGIGTVLKCLSYAGALASALRSAGRGIASLAGAKSGGGRSRGRGPAHLRKYQFKRAMN